MTMPAVSKAVPTQAWLDALAAQDRFVEVVDGDFVIKCVGGNPHHYLVRRLAEEFERQWPGTIATAPGNWALVSNPQGVVLGRMPDVLVDGQGLLEAVFTGTPDAVVEVWSPGNTLAEMNMKRREYRDSGVPVFVEAFLTDSGDVHLEWLVNAGEGWVAAAVAVGERMLDVAAPRAFSVVPNDLLRRLQPKSRASD